MAYIPRRLIPADALLFNSAGVLAGLRAGSSGDEIYGLTRAQYESMVAGVGITTWSNRSAIVAAGLTTAFFTDFGIGGSYWDYLGGRWRPQARSIVLKNLTSAVGQTTTSRVVMDFCTLLPGMWQDGDTLVNESYAVIVSGTTVFTYEYGIGTGSGTYGTSLGYTDNATLSNSNPGLRRTIEWRRQSGTVIVPESANTPSGSGSSTAITASISSGFDLDANTHYIQLAGTLSLGSGPTAALRKSRWTLLCGA